MVKIRTFWEAVEFPQDKKVYEVNNAPSMTVDDGYEDLSDMIPRIIRGELPPMRQSYYELQGNVSDDDFDLPVVDNLDDLTDIDSSQDIIARSSALRRNEEAEETKRSAVGMQTGSEAAADESQPKADQ